MPSAAVTAENGFEDLILVGGAPRSGTTLVQNILDSHPRVYGGPEFTVLSDIVHLRNRIGGEIDRGNLRPYGTRADLDRCLRQMILGFLRSAALRVNATRISEKSPSNCLVFAELLSLFPLSRAVHVVRDPVDTFLSMRSVRQRHIDGGIPLPPMLQTDESIANTISEYMEAGHAACVGYADRVVEVRYEDVTTATESTVAKICETVGLDLCPSMLEPSKQPHDTDYIIEQSTPWYTPEQYFRPIEDKQLKSRRPLQARELSALTDAFSGKLEILRSLGYDTEWGS